MKKCFCLLVLCFASICAMAQETRELKHVRLRSGLNVTGYVTNNADGSISVTTVDGDQLWYSSAEVRSIDTPAEIEAQRKAEAKRDKRSDGGGSTMKEKGFQFNLEAEIAMGNVYKCFLKVSPCYRFSKNLLAGIEIGYGYYSGGEWEYWSHSWHLNYEGLSIEGVLQYDFANRTRFMPYLGLNAGVSFDDLILGGELGFKVRITKSGGPHLSCFYELIREYPCIGGKLGWTF